MKIKRSELNNLILEVTQNSEISKRVAFIIDKQGVDVDEAITIYINDTPGVDENTVTQALTDFPISNGMDTAFMGENLNNTIDDVLKELEDEELEDEFEEPELGVPEEDPLEDPLEEPLDEPLEEPASDEETAEDLYGGEQTFNSEVQRALTIINQVIKEPREYFALMNGQPTPEGKPEFPGVMHMVVMNPREKRRAMRVILGKRIGDLVMDKLEGGEESLNEGSDNENS